MNILITGTSSGLGYELAKQFSLEGHNVYGMSRKKSNLQIKQVQVDFVDLQSVAIAMNNLIDITKIDLVILNAGQLGEINKTNDIKINQFNDIFNINVLSNKVIIDWLLNHNISVKSIIGISTGAALKAYHGWSLYCASKAAFKQLLSTYAYEESNIHFLSLAPGIIKTKMQEYIYEIDSNKIPSVKKFKDMFSTMDTADIVANKIINNLPYFSELESGDYLDLRNI
tara:strand:+ start:5021 stop:5701 length:681 start_codon:yes stop_codon:yes gene_type:complete